MKLALALALAPVFSAGGSALAVPLETPPAARVEQARAETTEEETRAKVEKYLRLAREGRVAVRPQAARRLVQLGGPAREALRALVEAEGLAALGPYLVETLAEYEDDELRAELWGALGDRDFPWRGPAARSLALAPEPTEAVAFRSLLADLLWQVRRAALDGLRALDSHADLEPVRALLRDPEGAVRRAAAALAFDWGERGALRYLVEELSRVDAYFRIPLGAQARFDATKLLSARLGSDFGFQPGKLPTEAGNAQALAKLTAAARELAGEAWPAELPPIARLGQPVEGAVLGLELRSCRRGEFYLRWTEHDELWVGTGNAARLSLEPGTVARLAQEISALLEDLGEARTWGQAGCDLEQLRCVDAEGGLQTFLLSKGQAQVSDLRPEPLDRVVALLVETLPDEPAEDPRLAHLARRARAALEVLGGPY